MQTHIYQRVVDPNSQDSLAKVQSRVPAESRVLELGAATGYFTQFLTQKLRCEVDAVEIDASMAERVTPWCQKLIIGDLDQLDLVEHFLSSHYDVVVCADVLEHLRNPARTLFQINKLLKPDGKLLISLPNVAYAGLIASLLDGNFDYREEGLLDQGHLRFFTKFSLEKLLNKAGFYPWHWDAVVRPLGESEFKTRLERYPCAVADMLLQREGSLVYQWIVEARLSPTAFVVTVPETPMMDMFPIRGYPANDLGVFSLDRSRLAWGTVGRDHQLVKLELPQTRVLRLSLADRSGFIRFYGLSLKDSLGQTLWQWSDADKLEQLIRTSHQVHVHEGEFGSPLFLWQADSWIELHCPEMNKPLELWLELGWPMSSDFVATKNYLDREVAEIGKVLQQAQQTLSDKDAALQQERQTRIENQQLLIEAQEQNAACLMQLNAASIGSLRHFQAQKTRPLCTTSDVHPRFIATEKSALVRTIDIIVPVFLGLDETRACLQSVLNCTLNLPCCLIVVDDASPSVEISQYIDTLATSGKLILLRNTQNLGFAASVNRAIELHPQHDVVLLNSDTCVANDWLERLQACAYSADRIGTATPFSNNATICSYPYEGWAGSLPGSQGLAGIDEVCANVNAGVVIDIPTAVGFCMFIRRDCLAETGLFDAARFGAGYGEENDFCMRASALGWRHCLAADVFVFHQGSVSFSDRSQSLQQTAIQTLQALYPDYLQRVTNFVGRQAIEQARNAIHRARMECSDSERRHVLGEQLGRASASHGIKSTRLHITHGLGGGTAVWVNDFCRADISCRNLVLQSVVSGNNFGARLLLYEPAAGDKPMFEWQLATPIANTAMFHGEYQALLEQVIDLFDVSSILVSSLIGHCLGVLDIDLPTGVIWHDHYPFCPVIYATLESPCLSCSTHSLQECHSHNPHNIFRASMNITDWLAVRTAYADKLMQPWIRVIAPSKSAVDRWLVLVPTFQNIQFSVIPHGLEPGLLGHPLRLPVKTSGERLRIVVVGKLFVHKGQLLLEAALDRLLEFADILLLGCGNFHYVLRGKEKAFKDKPGLELIDTYERHQLGELVHRFRPNAAMLISVWPETFCYTLSEMLALHIPVVATRLGALAERIEDGVNGFLVEPNADALVTRLKELHDDPHLLHQVACHLAEVPVRTTRQMVADYRQLFGHTKANPRGLGDLALTALSKIHTNLQQNSSEHTTGASDILYAWEFGAHLGHVGSFLPLAEKLRKMGHAIHWVVAQTAQVGTFLAQAGFNWMPAPSVAEDPRGGSPLSYTDILLHFGYADAGTLFGLVGAWRTLMQLTRARLILVDHAPTAVLAARTLRIPVMLFSNGFTVPPRQKPFPVMRPWNTVPIQTLVQLDQTALANINLVLAQFACAPLPDLASLFDVAEETLVTFPELDHYSQRGSARYWGSLPSAGIGASCTWPTGNGPKIFAYLRRDCVHHAAMLEVLRALGCPTIVYFPGMLEEHQHRLASPHLLFLKQPADIAQMTREADLAVNYASLATTTAFLLAGKPLLMLPVHLEQFLVARRVVEMAAGLLVSPEQASGELQTKLTDLLTNPSYRVNAKAFASRYKAFNQEQVIHNLVRRIAELMSDTQIYTS